MIPSRIAATTAAQLKMLFRRRITLFWSLVFPMILMTLLGLLFGRSIDAGTITVIDRAGTTQSQRLVAAVEHTDGVTGSVTAPTPPGPSRRCATATVTPPC